MKSSSAMKNSTTTKNHVRSAAAALLGSTLLLGAAAPFAFAADANNAAGQAVATSVTSNQAPAAANAATGVTVTNNRVEQSTDALETDLNIPILSGMKDSAYQNTLNANIAARAKAAATAMSKQANDDKAAADGSYEFRPYGVTVDYELVSDGSAAADGILSLKVYTYTYTGGAHGSTVVDTYNVRNAAKAMPVRLKELFGANYKSIIDRAVTAEVNAYPDYYFADAKVAISDSQAFVVRHGLAFVIFQQYDIAPYAAGMPEIAVTIPGSSANVPAGASNLPLAVDGKNLTSAKLYAAPRGNVMAPLRSVAAALGYAVHYDAKTHETTLSKGAFTASVMTGEDRYAYADAYSFSLGDAPSIKGGSLYVPLNFFSSALNANLAYTKQAVTLTSGKVPQSETNHAVSSS